MNLRKIIINLLIIIIIVQYCTISYSTSDSIEQIQENNEANASQVQKENDGMKIYSESAILIEENTGKILYEKNIHERKYPASTTKILTAIIALEKCDLSETATASEYAVTSVKSGYTKANIQVGETFTIEQLLDVLMLQSANEAANIIAEHISGSVSEFAKLMNDKAKEIGCLDSNFVNPNGMHNENHYSTAYDLAMIARYCMKNQQFRDLAKKMECSLPRTEYWTDEQVEEHGERNFKNTNNLLIPDNRYYYPYAIGIKSGFTTPAKNCLIAASNKDGFETISVILHAEATDDNLSARYLDTINLFEYGYNNYDLKEILEEYNMEDMMPIVNESTDIEVVEDINEDGDIIEHVKISKEVIEMGIGIILIVLAIFFIFRKGRYEYV